MDINYLGTPLAALQVDAKLINDINSVCDQIVKLEKLPKILDNREKLYSAVNKEFVFPHASYPPLADLIVEKSKEFHRKILPTETGPLNVTIENTWVVSMKSGEWNNVHAHFGSISGVLYLKVPQSFTDGLEQNDKRVMTAGKICFFEGGGAQYRKSSILRQPKVGDLYLFPSHLTHFVYPFFSDEERRSLSFNVTVTSEKAPK